MYKKEYKCSIAKDFSQTPGPRYIREGDNSGELFRKTVLFPLLNEVLKNKGKLTIDLDGTAGFGTSFLEESFGGLIREESLDYNTLVSTIDFLSDEEPYLIEDIKEYLKEANNEKTK